MLRIINHPILGPKSTASTNASPSHSANASTATGYDVATVTFTFDNQLLKGLKGEPIAAALLANHIRTLRRHEETGAPRGLYCAIGHCMECRVSVDGTGTVRSCLTPLEENMVIHSGQQLPNAITGRDVE
ncbi:(2Fe-2S)-binding protein [Alicyclobacillus sp. ALC3]|uniref:(2Fe-2S)-binding protein n=1 Tax=Alicyclobacillus sp. ALC3 TaxID=2796143 RepID=UPI002379A9D1|nr:(2Fe-2S)-binding protein [Alicyclobacillus sp. ALC3]WDL97654.1 (2Fe-2S)-binding protein [Alicyclobacillus sp. ALC3]